MRLLMTDCRPLFPDNDKAGKRNQGEAGCERERHRVGAAFGDEGEHHGRHALHQQRRAGAAAASGNPNSASSANPATSTLNASRTTHNGCTFRAKANSQIRAATWEGPNSAPIITAVAGSMPWRAKIASRWGESPEGTRA